MVIRKSASGKKRPAKLKLKKETLRDLDAKGRAARVQGGLGGPKNNTKATCPTILPPSMGRALC